MRTLRTTVALFCLGTAWLAIAPGASAAAQPAWQLSLIPMPTNFKPGTTGTEFAVPIYRLVATNVGGAPAAGIVTLRVTMPSGLVPLVPFGNDGDMSSPDPSCAAVGQEVTCTAPGPVHPGRWLGATVPLEVAAAQGEALTATASVKGGGAAATASYEAEVSAEPPPFGFLDGPTGFSTLFTDADGSAATASGAHPDQITFSFAFPTEQHVLGGPATGAGHVRALVTDLPRGLVVNPSATSVRCSEAELLEGGGAEPGCPTASQLGMVNILTEINGPVVAISPLYNMQAPPGSPAQLAFDAINTGIFVHLQGRVRTGSDYGLSAVTEDILARTNNPILTAQAQLWGDPSGASHDQIRGECRPFGGACPIPGPEQTSKPLLTMPSHCSEDPLLSTATASSWEEPAVLHTREAQTTDTAGNPVGLNGCSTLKFNPSLTLRPDTAAAESPTGVEIELEVPQNEGLGERATSNVKDATVAFPEGMAVNPAAAAGRQACTPDQIDLHSAERPHCPDSAKIGTVEVASPLLDHTVPGAVYVAQPYENPFGTLLAVYFVVDSPADGIVVKLAGKTEADPDNGQLTTTFKENPELPFSSFKVNLFGGPRAVLRTPSTCGTYTTTSVQAPWSGNPPAHTTDSFQVTSGPNGKPCVTEESQMPNNPGFKAGTQTPIAAGYSPFLGRLTREDGEQQLDALNATLPPGLTGKLAGVSTCSDAAVAAAEAKSGEEEQSSPSCPAASQIGQVKAGAGAGPNPYYTTGKVYLAGPYKGAPLSGVAITPAVAGPFDLGNVVIRAPAYVDPVTAQLSLKSDLLPHILEGIPLELRDARIELDRDEFTLNPSSCSEKQITGEAISLLGSIAPLSERFQVGGCKGLDYAPKLFIRLSGGTRRGAHPKLRAVLEAKPGEEANTARASVALPRSEFLENAHIQTVCTRVQFAADQCPQGSIYGSVKAITPLLDEPLTGPVYLRSSSHELPDMVAVLNGPADKPIEVELAGRIDSINGGIRTTFDFVPDQPVTKAIFYFKGGNKGLIVNSRDICAHTYRATAKFDGQNGKVHDFRPKLKASCGKGKARHKRRR